ncbi:hypothetical protein COT42_03405 [Candidatus Saganbacteria bacterium CG08_land_8_20_14_0_20_45_16]|uniref:Uncharacterized protein n=1 Tax=Candidatus Saganbacteria bacterium CG08_land_8_20_14_0_20_45_16 TaxID=2014293 RepID=A0A2H0Y149_UNCSA|nr:MAG: hypothetical protein COT42_03405 [Candidatus Saganbacteria bacterium CG08_land_8_20_14_0_20_45_16]
MTENGNGNGGKEIFKKMVRAGRRTYFVAVKESKNNHKYLMLTESKLVEKDKFDYNTIMIFPEKVADLVKSLEEANQVLV